MTQIQPIRSIHSICATAFLSAVCFLVFSMTFIESADAQLAEGSVVLSEFFEELYLVDVDNSTVVDILDSPITENVNARQVEVLDQNTILVSDDSGLIRYDVGTQTTSPLATLPPLTSEFTRDLNGNLISVSPFGVHRIDGNTGASTLLHDETFFNPSDTVVDSNGNIYVTEFFEGLGVVGPNGGYRGIGDFAPNQFSNIDIGLDGQLYLAGRTDRGFWRVDPDSGAGTLLGTDLFTALDDLQVDEDGNILFSGSGDNLGDTGVFLFDPLSGTTTTIIDGDDINNGFFDGTDIDIFESELRFTNLTDVPTPSLPEPSSAVLLVFAGLGSMLRRRRI